MKKTKEISADKSALKPISETGKKDKSFSDKIEERKTKVIVLHNKK